MFISYFLLPTLVTKLLSLVDEDKQMKVNGSLSSHALYAVTFCHCSRSGTCEVKGIGMKGCDTEMKD
jgi:hypothetical protein